MALARRSDPSQVYSLRETDTSAETLKTRADLRRHNWRMSVCALLSPQLGIGVGFKSGSNRVRGELHNSSGRLAEPPAA